MLRVPTRVFRQCCDSCDSSFYILLHAMSVVITRYTAKNAQVVTGLLTSCDNLLQQADIRMRSYGLIISTGLLQRVSTSCNKSADDKLQQAWSYDRHVATWWNWQACCNLLTICDRPVNWLGTCIVVEYHLLYRGSDLTSSTATLSQSLKNPIGQLSKSSTSEIKEVVEIVVVKSEPLY